MSWQIKLKTLSDYTHKYVVAESGCWEWQGHLNKGGYGTDTYGSRIDGSRRQMLAHRMFYMLANKDYTEELKVLHKCDNRKCVNPKHLWIGTQKDNMRDCVQKGRHITQKGEANFHNKLKPAEVLKIRELLDGGVKQKSLAAAFGVNQTLISAIKTRKIWREL